MTISTLIRWLAAAALAASASRIAAAAGQDAPRFTPHHVIQFNAPTDQQRTALSSPAFLRAAPSLASIVADRFMIALEDLNDDGAKEIIVVAASSMSCGSGGCSVVVLEYRAGRTVVLLDQGLAGSLAVTNEKIDGYRALASVDRAGAIAVGDKPGTPMSGRQLVYPMTVALRRPPPAPGTAGPSVCGDRPLCSENLSFAATVTDFQAILQNTSIKTVTLRLAIRNKLARPLILGYVSGSGVATDDRGNRYTISGDQSVHGLGQIRGNQAEQKFVLQPGETSDARFEYAWAGPNIFGVTFEVDLAIREIEMLPGGQMRLGREHALHFSGLADRRHSTPGMTSPLPPPVAVAPPPTAPGPAAPPVADPNACRDKPLCQAAGPFTAQIVGLTRSNLPTSAAQVVQMRVRFTNPAGVPIILGYVRDTASATDEFGRRYSVHFGTDGVKGMGTVDRTAADTQFVLAAGTSGEAAFAVSVVGNLRTAVADTFNFDVTIALLESLAGGQNRTVREYSLGFSGVAAAAIVNTSAGGCAGKSRCYGEGPLVAEVTGITRSVDGQRTPIDLRMQFRNVTSRPLILGYVADSAVITDNYGQRYAVRMFGDGVRGIGEVTVNSADPQFVLKPGASGTVTFILSIVSSPSAPVGTSFTFDATLAHLEILPSQQIRTVREYAVYVPNLSAAGPGFLQKLLELPKRKGSGGVGQ